MYKDYAVCTLTKKSVSYSLFKKEKENSMDKLTY